jgi:hypothetical protein
MKMDALPKREVRQGKVTPFPYLRCCQVIKGAIPLEADDQRPFKSRTPSVKYLEKGIWLPHAWSSWGIKAGMIREKMITLL